MPLVTDKCDRRMLTMSLVGGYGSITISAILIFKQRKIIYINSGITIYINVYIYIYIKVNY